MASAKKASRGTFSIAASTRRSAMPRPAIWRRTMRRRGSVTVAMTAKRPTPTRVAKTCDLFRTARVLLPHLGIARAPLGFRRLQLGGFLEIPCNAGMEALGRRRGHGVLRRGVDELLGCATLPLQLVQRLDQTVGD